MCLPKKRKFSSMIFQNFMNPIWKLFIYSALMYQIFSILYDVGCKLDILAGDAMTAQIVDCDEEEFCSEQTFMCGKYSIGFLSD